MCFNSQPQASNPIKAPAPREIAVAPSRQQVAAQAALESANSDTATAESRKAVMGRQGMYDNIKTSTSGDVGYSKSSRVARFGSGGYTRKAA